MSSPSSFGMNWLTDFIKSVIYGPTQNQIINSQGNSLTIKCPTAGGPDGSVTFNTALDLIELHENFANGSKFFSHDNASFRAPFISFFKSRGTQATPTAVQLGDSLGGHLFGGFDGTVYTAPVGINASATENWSPTNRGMGVVLTAVGNGSIVSNNKFTLDGNGGKYQAFNVASLPAGAEGSMSYAANGRKVGELAGAGTGVPVYFSAGSWRVFSTDTPVAA